MRKIYKLFVVETEEILDFDSEKWREFYIKTIKESYPDISFATYEIIEHQSYDGKVRILGVKQ